MVRAMRPAIADEVRTRARLWIAPLVGWTLVQWTSRIQIVLDIDDLEGFAVVWRVGVAALFLVLGLLCLSWLVFGRPGAMVLGVLAGWTVAYWLVRGTGIMLDSNHDARFKLVHAVLMAMSIGLVLVAAAGVRRVADEQLDPPADT